MSSIFNPPDGPNPTKVAEAQSAANKETAIAQANLNNYNQITPQGSLIYTVIGTNSDGTPKYQATQTYSPQQQQIYNSNTANQLKASTTAGTLMNNVGAKLSQPFTTGTSPQQQNVNLNQNAGLKTDLALDTDLGLNGNLSYAGSPSLDDSAVSDRINQLGQQRLDPRFAREQQTLESDLSNRGVVPGTEAYKQAMARFGETKNDAYNQLALTAQDQMFNEQAQRRGMANTETTNSFDAANAAIQGNADFGNNAQVQQGSFNNAGLAQNNQMNNQAAIDQGQFNNSVLAANHNQQIQDKLLERQTPLNEFSALMSGGQVSQPNYVNTPQTSVANTDVAGIKMAAAKNQTDQWNAMMGGIAGIGGAAAGAYFSPTPSDRRLKKDIHKLGSLAKGVGIYAYKYKPELLDDGGLQHIGVMAQEIEKKMPDAVSEIGDSGYKAVDYARVLEEVA